MTALYLLANEYRAAAMVLADLDMDAQTVSNTLESLSGELEVKAESVAFMVRAIEADAAAMKAWAASATERAKAAESRAKSLREYLAACMDGAGMIAINRPGVRLSFRHSTAIEIDGIDLIPDAFMRHPEPPPPAPDKVAIAAEWKAGRPVAGTHQAERKSLQIK